METADERWTQTWSNWSILARYMVNPLNTFTGSKGWFPLSCAIASIVRLAYDIKSTKGYSQLSSELQVSYLPLRITSHSGRHWVLIIYDYLAIEININIWSQIGPCISIIVACQPLLSPLLPIQKWIGGVRSYVYHHSFFKVSEGFRRGDLIQIMPLWINHSQGLSGRKLSLQREKNL